MIRVQGHVTSVFLLVEPGKSFLLIGLGCTLNPIWAILQPNQKGRPTRTRYWYAQKKSAHVGCKPVQETAAPAARSVMLTMQLHI